MPEDVKPVKTPKTETPEVTKADTAAPAAGAPKKGMSKNAKIVIIVVSVVVGLMILSAIGLVVLAGSLFDKAGVDVDDGQVTVQTEQGDATTNYGENVELAQGFPTDVPIFEPSTLMASTKVSDASFSAVGKTASSVNEVTNYYKEQMSTQGWTSTLDSTSGDGTLLTYSKGDRTVGIVITTSADEASNEKTGFVVTVTTQTQ